MVRGGGRGVTAYRILVATARSSLLRGDTTERAEADRRIVKKWEEAHGVLGIKVAADVARAKLL